jgi:hypothetical protein
MTRWISFFASAALMIAISLAWYLETHAIEPIALTPALTGQTEYCLTCHNDLPEISPSHPVKTFGCVICHGGEALALDADLAHSTLRGGANPSDLSVVAQSCGGSSCHSGSAADQNDHIQRVMTSLQSTYAGAIASILYTFGAQPDLTARYGVNAVGDDQVTTPTGLSVLVAFDPAQLANPIFLQFAQGCLTCHVDAEPRPGEAFARLTGCAACHTPQVASFPPGQVHQLTTTIPYTQCDTCHNRGNYDLRTLSFVERRDQPADRLGAYYQPIAQFTRCEYTLDCVDCHTRTEVMGDGDIHASMNDIQYVQCQTCHGTPTALPLTKTLTDPDDIAFRLAQLNTVVDLQLGDTVLVTAQGEPLWNTRLLPDGTYQLVGKATRQVFTFKPVMGSGCIQDGVDQSSAYCHTCHAVRR